ncbi:TetR/AcrR family transcriptional regulator [Arthrobacter sp. SLBN-53]|uniref:TetR/AcrR family transcriptional regulator n=1 Tax=Arthrobacter sp. SLBN-53 TaxID=2768412 RepID=UPI001151692C|nr:TetR/AcrR family transcriptional regulator [Arthrobacter sp. SLBN-53]TQK32064.1 TetR family transcriptional regulator [Arthrobacter sp. SLBN-53]
MDLSALAASLTALEQRPGTSSRERMLDAALAEFVNHGIARTSVAAIAHRAGVSRPTLYRQCGDKDQIVAAVTQREVVGFFSRAYPAVSAKTSIEDKMIEVFVMGMREVRSHPMLRALLEYESDTFTRRILDMDASRYRDYVSAAATILSDEEYSAEAIERALDVSLRITATLVISPSPYVVVDDEATARAFAHRYLIPVLQASR